VPIPKLSARAEAVVAALAVAPDDKARAGLWRGIAADQGASAELRSFSTAVRQRFGDDTVRAMLRSQGRAVEAPSVPRQHQDALTVVSRTVHALQEGEFASASQAQTERLTQRQSLGHRPRLRP